MRWLVLGCNVGLHQVTDLHSASLAFPRACNVSGHQRLGFITARLYSFKALGPPPVVDERSPLTAAGGGSSPSDMP